jgi:prepilin-type N-terminal cleavage/methylation domain-containing protein
MKKKQGFTLIELMIVVAIIAILAAIAIPNMLRAQMNSRESAAIKTLKTILDAQGSYFSREGAMSPDYTTLTAPPTGPPYLNGTWDATVARSGYFYVMTVPDAYSFVCEANPEIVDKSGSRAFFLDDGGNIHEVDGAGPAGVGDKLISES